MKLLCKHQYKLYNVSVYSPLWMTIFTYNKYDFVCAHCGKEKSIKSLDLQDELLKEKADQAKKKATGRNYQPCNSEDLAITLRPSHIATEFRGGFVKIVKDRYSKKGFNLNEINERNRYGQHVLIEEDK